MTIEIDKSKIIRDASTVILLRHDKVQPQVLMGQRGAKAAFMPNKFVFPGGAVDAEDYSDHGIALDARLDVTGKTGIGPALVTAGIRELWEETGQKLTHLQENFRFIFRAITPPGRPRRFDARFFLADAHGVTTNIDDFSNASDELSNLHWIDLVEAKALDLPFVTEVVLSEVLAICADPHSPRKVPFFNHTERRSYFSLL